jgi:dethiobiotin synthetase
MAAVIRLFVTGTDTGVGKTYVGAALLREGVRRGWSVIGHKPIETGCKTVDGRRVAADAIELASVIGEKGAAQHALALPAAPAVAAARENLTIDVDDVVEKIRHVVKDKDLALVEGAGGWRVPITPTEDMAGLAARLQWPVLIVARAGLGTINHTLLTIEAVEYDGCEVWGVALSVRPDDEPAFACSNREEIAKRAGCPVWLFEPGRVLDRDGAR